MYKKKFEIKEHLGAIYSLAKDNRFIYSSSSDKFVTRWDPNSGEQDNFSIKCDSSIYKIHHSQNQHVLVIGTSAGDIHVVDTKLKEEVKFIRYHKVAIFDIQLDEIKNLMYVGDADGNLSVWDTISWKLLLNLPFDCGKIRSILILNDLNRVLIGSQDGKIRVIESDFFNLIHVFNSHKNGCFSLIHTELKKNVLFSSGKDGYIRAWDLKNFKQLIAIPAHNESIYKLKIYKNYLVSTSRDKTCKIWDIKTLDFVLKLDRKLGGHTHSVNDILIIEPCIITASDDKRIICWEPN